MRPVSLTRTERPEPVLCRHHSNRDSASSFCLQLKENEIRFSERDGRATIEEIPLVYEGPELVISAS